MKFVDIKNSKKCKILSCVAAAAVAFSMSAAPAFAAADKTLKDETVYVVTESDGSESDLIVSDHLKNRSGSDVLNDVSPLTDIENVKGDEKFEQGEDGSLTWDADGGDIFYQGKTDKSAPITMNVKYYLDDKEVEGKDLDGVSGKIKIVIDYENNETATVDGAEVKVPFAVLTGMVMEDDSFENVKVSSGRVIDDGEKSFIVGMAVPGLAESLGISEEELGFGSTVEITGDAEDFTPEDLISIVTNDFLDDVDDNIADFDLDAQIEELEDAANQLVEGTNTLYEGIHTLQESSGTLASGIGKLNSGAQSLNTGAKATLEGSRELAAGTAKLSASLNSSLATMKAGVGKLKAGVTAVQNGLTAINSGLTSLGSGFDTAKETLDSGYSADAAVLKYLQSIDQTSMTDEEKAELNRVIAYVQGSMQASKGVSDSLAQSSASTDGTLRNGLAKLQAGVSSTDATNPGLITAMSQVAAGLTDLSDGLAAATGDTNSLTSGAKELADGANDLVAGEAQISGRAAELASGMSQLNDKTGLLISGVNQLDAGSKTLRDGMKQFYEDGIEKIVTLYNDELKGTVSNAQALLKAGKEYDTFTQLADGMDGSVKFIYRTKVAD